MGQAMVSYTRPYGTTLKRANPLRLKTARLHSGSRPHESAFPPRACGNSRAGSRSRKISSFQPSRSSQSCKATASLLLSHDEKPLP
jgi:hypothetical protein